jgi:spore coat protein U-like protein
LTASPNLRLAAIAALGVLTCILPSAANAGSGSTPVTVSATVTQNCTISTTTNVGFGSYDPVTISGAVTTSGVVKVTCTKGASGITLTLNGGGNSASATSPDTRAMKGATNANYLSYDLYEDSGYATRFPVTAVSETVSGGITTPTNITLYGKIKATAQDVAVDAYGDTVQATVNF